MNPIVKNKILIKLNDVYFNISKYYQKLAGFEIMAQEDAAAFTALDAAAKNINLNSEENINKYYNNPDAD